MSTIDLSLPLATLLRESTREAHELVENSPGATALLGGHLSREEYVRYLMMLWHIYNTFEQALDRHATHPSLEPTYNPALLRRAPALADDISYLLQVPLSSWKSHRVHIQLQASMPPALEAYVSRIQQLADAADPSALLAHSYVRYLGDLSGGQMVRRRLGKAYGLNEADGLGLTFYEFKELGSSNGKNANQGDMKQIKDWFREGMNTAGNISTEVKASVIAEANNAFDLNTGLFDAIQVEEKDAVDYAIPVIDRQLQKAYSLSQVLAVIMAVGLAHFILVTGGFTGERGYQKFLALQQWFVAVSEAEA